MARNKSCASNRGRATARFNFRTLKSIAIGFRWLLLLSRPPSLSFAQLLSHSILLPPVLKSDVLIGFLIGYGNLITRGTIKHPWEGREKRKLVRPGQTERASLPTIYTLFCPSCFFGTYGALEKYLPYTPAILLAIFVML